MNLMQRTHFINGEFVENRSDKWIDVINPATEGVLGQVAEGTKEDAQRAIDAAEAAQAAWEALPAVERGVWLHKIAQGIRQREKQLTDNNVAEGGTTQGLKRRPC